MLQWSKPFLLLLGTYCTTVQTTTVISDYSIIVIISIELYPIYLLGGETCEMKCNEMKDFVRFCFEYPTSKAAD